MQESQRKAWTIVLAIAVAQLSLAGYANYSSRQYVWSDAACIGGTYGSLANIILLLAIVAVVTILAVKSLRAKAQHPLVAPLLFLAVTTLIAIGVGMYAGLRCTV